MSEGSLCSWIACAQLAPVGSQAFYTVSIENRSAGTSLLAIGGLCEEEDLNDDGGHVGEKSHSRSDALKTIKGSLDSWVAGAQLASVGSQAFSTILNYRSSDAEVLLCKCLSACHQKLLPQLRLLCFYGQLNSGTGCLLSEGTRDCALVEESVPKPRLQATTDQWWGRGKPWDHYELGFNGKGFPNNICRNSELEHKEYETSRGYVGSNLLFKARALAVMGDGQHLSGGSAVTAVLRWQREAGNRVVSEPDGGAVLR
ncbi:unnamed protein product [Linum trigynum]|uniref:Uncharacterized protein n=1 Tax=Linum trigynum TaxID=586398 RepID=A0AAV2ET14_9ROSI